MIFFFSGFILALLSAFLFGISPVLIKSIVGEMPPLLMAGLLYLGSGISLLSFRIFRREGILQGIKGLSSLKKWKLAGAIVFGGVLAPIFLVYGIRYGSAFEVAAFLNLETVATTLIAWFLFHEHVSKRVWVGKIVILLGAFLMSTISHSSLAFSRAALFVVASCIFWGMDNNLTRDIEDLPASVLAGLKGLCAGSFNIGLAWMFREGLRFGSGIIKAMGIGAVSYGLSLVLFIYALRKIGASRTSTYFASGPFIGMVCAVIFLGDRPPVMHWVAGAFMLLGVYVLYREHHEHEHTHEAITHSHLHVHDEHHQHEHRGIEAKEPHEHAHTHKSMKHSHPHLPDIHHRHSH